MSSDSCRCCLRGDRSARARSNSTVSMVLLPTTSRTALSAAFCSVSRPCCARRRREVVAEAEQERARVADQVLGVELDVDDVLVAGSARAPGRRATRPGSASTTVTVSIGHGHLKLAPGRHDPVELAEAQHDAALALVHQLEAVEQHQMPRAPPIQAAGRSRSQRAAPAAGTARRTCRLRRLRKASTSLPRVFPFQGSCCPFQAGSRPCLLRRARRGGCRRRPGPGQARFSQCRDCR